MSVDSDKQQFVFVVENQIVVVVASFVPAACCALCLPLLPFDLIGQRPASTIRPRAQQSYFTPILPLCLCFDCTTASCWLSTDEVAGATPAVDVGSCCSPTAHFIWRALSGWTHYLQPKLIPAPYVRPHPHLHPPTHPPSHSPQQHHRLLTTPPSSTAHSQPPTPVPAMFSRGSKGPKLSEQEQAKLRVTQLQQFIKLNPSAHPINSDNSAFELPIHTQYGRLTLYVHFPAAFPACPPVVQLTSLVSHPYVDTDMYVVNHPKIQHWDPHKSSAGLLLAELVSEWARTPPTPVTLAQVKQKEAAEKEEKDRETKERDHEWVHVSRKSSNANSPMAVSPSQPAAGQSPLSSLALPATSAASSHSPSSSLASSASRSSAAHLALPIPSTFDFLTSASLSELQTLDADPSLLHSHLATLPTWQHMQHIHSDMLDSLTEQAALSLQQQPDYTRARVEVDDARRAVSEESKEVEALVRRQQEVINRYSVERTLQQLQRLAEEAEKRGDAMRDRYMEGGDEDGGVASGAAAVGAGGEDGAGMADDEKDVSSARRGDRHSRFVEAFVKQRMAVHERLAKRERLMEWVTQRQQHAQ